MNKLTISAKVDKWAIRYRRVKTVMRYENRSLESQQGVPNCLLGIEASPVTGSWNLAYLIVWSGTIKFYVVYWLIYFFWKVVPVEDYGSFCHLWLVEPLPFALDFLHLSTWPLYMKTTYGFLILRYGILLLLYDFLISISSS